MSQSKGFTLIELLIVIAIIGILAVVAIPHFSRYRARGFDARAATDLKNIAVAEEAYFVDSETYKSCTEADCASVLPGVEGLSPGVLLSITATAGGFSGTSSHPQGTGQRCNWDTSTGGFLGCS